MDANDPLLKGIEQGNFNALARAITFVENDIPPATELLRTLKVNSKIPVIGITGPPGAGKSTLVNAITAHIVKEGKKIAILAVDPTSPFNFGSLLGDRIRMSQQFNNPNVYIRSLATRGALGGISAKTIEIVDVIKAAGFDMILVETVGVGQSEVEIAGLADKTVVVLVPESGDEIQNIKSGLMEIAQGFVVNKADREGADTFANNLKKLVHQQHECIPVFKTVADKQEGIAELCEWLLQPALIDNERKPFLLAEKAFKIIQYHRMVGIDRQKLLTELIEAMKSADFNIYRFTDNWV
ncbi:methylmalonyl Co-A mutase-associated GTPase MeaB [Pedobacter hiemivivus]|uniref:Methylmalonyl Co-A mutase-associated GTPase MeaB n=1 Tax=Pedobacter hiemivivus TaxID=2530454 RepID=A0A4R0NBA1_9SPHI|nr:methylmalonyl Co-A mutase-associated GTPase MeaB [Pedobacter hiemivivus]TCC97571.1 methylmalonyl Co-A mutase-associated GTPase MeaB [Pedobacter hiemivivus]